METITIHARVPARATYLRHVIEAGHRPGVLSGAELRGKARRFASYWRARRRAEELASEYGICHGLALIRSRWARVWMRFDGTPVSLTIAED